MIEGNETSYVDELTSALKNDLLILRDRSGKPTTRAIQEAAAYVEENIERDKKYNLVGIAIRGSYVSGYADRTDPELHSDMDFAVMVDEPVSQDIELAYSLVDTQKRRSEPRGPGWRKYDAWIYNINVDQLERDIYKWLAGDTLLDDPFFGTAISTLSTLCDPVVGNRGLRQVIPYRKSVAAVLRQLPKNQLEQIVGAIAEVHAQRDDEKIPKMRERIDDPKKNAEWQNLLEGNNLHNARYTKWRDRVISIFSLKDALATTS